jgi:hypothetical protein
VEIPGGDAAAAGIALLLVPLVLPLQNGGLRRQRRYSGGESRPAPPKEGQPCTVAQPNAQPLYDLHKPKLFLICSFIQFSQKFGFKCALCKLELKI